MDPGARRKKRTSTERSQIKSVKGDPWARPLKSLLINMRHSSGHLLCVERRCCAISPFGYFRLECR